MSDTPTMWLSKANDLALMHLARLWVWDGDLMRCRACNRAMVASRDGEEMRHAAGCRNSGHLHPWSDLRNAISPTLSPVVKT